MTTITFQQWQCNDAQPALMQEDALHRVLSFSGIHDVESLDVIPDPSVGYSFEDDQGTWSYASGVLSGSGGSTAQWYKTRIGVPTTFGYVVEFDKTGDVGGFLFGCVDWTKKAYLVWWNGTRAGVSSLMDFTETKLIDISADTAGNASVRIAIKPIAATVIDQPDDLAVSMWFDDQIVLSYAMEYDTNMGTKIGFAVYHDNACTYSGIRVAQFHQIVEVTYVGPNEEASASLGRLLGMDKIRVQARFDGSVLIWRNTVTTAAMNLPTSAILSMTRKRNKFAPNHYKLIGGLYEGDVIQGMAGVSGTEQFRGHIFTSATDPNANIEDDVFQRATRKAIEAVETADTLEIAVRFKPLLEAEDVIGIYFSYAVSPTYYRVTTIDFQASWESGGGIKYQNKITLRKMLSAF